MPRVGAIFTLVGARLAENSRPGMTLAGMHPTKVGTVGVGRAAVGFDHYNGCLLDRRCSGMLIMGILFVDGPDTRRILSPKEHAQACV